jgi:hypothetical protein
MQKTALNVSGVIFLVVALLHAWRFAMKIPVTFGPTSVPLTASVLGALAGFLLALWMFVAANTNRQNP